LRFVHDSRIDEMNGQKQNPIMFHRQGARGVPRARTIARS
jgi:hypothetical protein